MYFFFLNDTATTEIYTLSLHDALPICLAESGGVQRQQGARLHRLVRVVGTEHVVHDEDLTVLVRPQPDGLDRKSTRLNSSHANISYAVFCLKKKINNH